MYDSCSKSQVRAEPAKRRDCRSPYGRRAAATMQTKIARANIAKLILLVLSFGGIGRAQVPPTVSVCEVLMDLERWSGKLIAVRGELAFGTSIYAVREDNCTVLPQTDGVKWISSITLMKPPESAN